MVNNKGWVRVVEAFFAIMLLAGVIVFVYETYHSKEDFSDDIYLFEKGILDQIKVNSSLRTAVLGVEDDSGVPESLDGFLQERVPNYLNCEFVICSPGEICNLEKDIDGELFGKSLLLSSEGVYTDSKVLSLFCWIE